MNSKFLSITLATALILSSSSICTFAADNSVDQNKVYQNSITETENISIKDIEEIRTNLEEHNVPSDKIDILIKKIQYKIPWDNCIKDSDYKEEIATKSTYSENDTMITTRIFNDGSFQITSIIKHEFNNENSINNQIRSLGVGVYGGKVSSGSTYKIVTGARVESNLGFAKLAFNASYSIDRYGFDRITGCSQAPCVNYTSLNLSLDKSVEDNYGPARASLSGRPIWFEGGTVVLVLEVGNNAPSVYVEDI